MESSPILEIKNITKKFTAQQVAIDDVSLTLEKGELLGLLGPSGCGKTTLLRIIAGFEKISQGEIYLKGSLVSDRFNTTPPEKRHTGMVFQDYALFPHLTVEKNIAFGLKGKKNRNKIKFRSVNHLSDSQIKERSNFVLNLVGLSGLGKRYPHELSGGQQQRVALARALAPQPDLILLDEPLSNLDVQVRHRLREEIRRILKAAGTSAIFVTHDREEALAISDKIAVMRKGQIEQMDTPEAIYTQPSSRFVAEFVTQANFLPAKRDGKCWRTEIGELEIGFSYYETESDTLKGETHCDRAELMLRQEDIVLTPDNNSAVVVKERQFLGREYHYCLETPSGKRLHARTNIGNAVEVGTRVNLSLMGEVPLIFTDSAPKHSLIAG